MGSKEAMGGDGGLDLVVGGGGGPRSGDLQRGMGAVANMVMGSAATKVLNLVKVPVLLVK